VTEQSSMSPVGQTQRNKSARDNPIHSGETIERSPLPMQDLGGYTFASTSARDTSPMQGGEMQPTLGKCTKLGPQGEVWTGFIPTNQEGNGNGSAAGLRQKHSSEPKLALGTKLSVYGRIRRGEGDGGGWV